MTIRLGLLAKLEVQAGKGDELQEKLASAQSLAVAEQGTVTWYAFKVDDTHYGIFDTFEDEAGLQAHAEGEISKVLGSAADLYASPPVIKTLQIFAAK